MLPPPTNLAAGTAFGRARSRPTGLFPPPPHQRLRHRTQPAKVNVSDYSRRGRFRPTRLKSAINRPSHLEAAPCLLAPPSQGERVNPTAGVGRH